MAELYPDLKDRPVKETICLFDVDNTLTPARLSVSAEMLKLLSELRKKCAIGFVSQQSLYVLCVQLVVNVAVLRTFVVIFGQPID